MAKTTNCIQRLKVEVNRLAKQFKVSKHDALMLWFGKAEFGLSDEEARDAISVEGANDKGIDLFHVDDELGKVRIVQGKWSETGDCAPKVSEVNSLTSSIPWLSSPEACLKDGKPQLAGAAEEYLIAVKEGYGVELWFVYAGPKSTNVDKQVSVYNLARENLDARRFLRHYHIGRLETVLDEAEGKIKRLETERIGIVENMYFLYEADFGDAMVATVRATELVRIYKKYEDSLFDRNVRLFLGARKGSINAGIAETLKGDAKSNFWAFNNGLTVVCSGFKKVKNSVVITNFCIVNGCQSTCSLADNEAALDPSVTVLVRFLAVSHELIEDVIIYTNSQNPIRAWDIASQNKTQRRLKKEFAELAKPYIYVTRRGDQPKEDMAKFRNGGKLRQIKFTDAGQYLAALSGYPVLAYKNKAFIFTSRHDDVFPQDINVETVLFAWVCGQIVKDVADERFDNATDAEKRILIKGGSLFTLAVLGHIATLRNGSFYMKSMQAEQITSNHGKDRLKKYADYAIETYINCVKDASENKRQELSTLIRSPEFFAQVLDRVEREYRKDKLRPDDWLKKVLPKLI